MRSAHADILAPQHWLGLKMVSTIIIIFHYIVIAWSDITDSASLQATVTPVFYTSIQTKWYIPMHILGQQVRQTEKNVPFSTAFAEQ